MNLKHNFTFRFSIFSNYILTLKWIALEITIHVIYVRNLFDEFNEIYRGTTCTQYYNSTTTMTWIERTGTGQVVFLPQ